MSYFALTQILLATLRSQEIVRIALYLSVISLAINGGINWLLIYGHLGAPEMGVAGAAVGTLVARGVDLIILIAYIIKKERNLNLRLKDYLGFDYVSYKDYLKLTAPMLVVQGLWGLNTALQTVILGHMTTAAIAANSVASTIFIMVKSTAIGASSAASIVIGQTIGKGDISLVKRYAKLMQRLFVVIGIFSGLLLFAIRIPLLGLYDLSPDTKEIANTFLIIFSVVTVTMSYQMPTNIGIIRGGGDTMFVVKMDIISIWLIVIPLSFFMAFVVKASPAVVLILLEGDNHEVFEKINKQLDN